MDSSEGSGKGAAGGWLVETVRATQQAISAADTTDEIGTLLPEALVEPAENHLAWIGQSGPAGNINVLASSHPVGEQILLSTEQQSRTGRTQETGTVETESVDPEYRYLQAEYDIPAVETTVTIPLGTDRGAVVHLYTDGELPADGIETLETVGGIIETGVERSELSAELDRERGRLESLRSLVSHDLGNPLNLAAGRLDLVGMDCESEHISHVERGLEQIEALADEGTEFVTVGRTVSDPEPLSLTAIADDCWEYASDDRGTLETEDMTVIADSERLRRTLNELFVNALAHTEGEISVEVGPLADEQGFYIADDGSGIPEDEREYVFDRGYTTESDRDGIGLAVVEEIAQAHGWAVALVESPGTRIEIRTERW